MGKLEDGKTILKALGLPLQQQTDIASYTLLALAGIGKRMPWTSAKRPSLKIHAIKEWVRETHGKAYAENTRETFRRQVLHQLEQARVVDRNPDDPSLAVNSPRTHYALTEDALAVVRAFGTAAFKTEAARFQKSHGALLDLYRASRDGQKVPVVLASGLELTLSPGEHNELQKAIVEAFAPRFAPGGTAALSRGHGREAPAPGRRGPGSAPDPRDEARQAPRRRSSHVGKRVASPHRSGDVPRARLAEEEEGAGARSEGLPTRPGLSQRLPRHGRVPPPHGRHRLGDRGLGRRSPHPHDPFQRREVPRTCLGLRPSVRFRIFPVADGGACCWGSDLEGQNRDFLASVDYRYFEYTARTHLPLLDGDGKHFAATALRIGYHHGLETLFTLIGAAIQAPDCVAGEDPAERFGTAWSRFANDFLSEVTRDEYNSLKHGFRAHLGGYTLMMGLEQTPGVPDFSAMQVFSRNEFGTTFFIQEPLSKKLPHFRLRTISVNWHPRAMADSLMLIACSIHNVIQYLKLHNGEPQSKIRFAFPEKPALFDDPWRMGGADSMSFNEQITPDDIEPFTRDEILARLRRSLGSQPPDDQPSGR
jgi:BsuBI/PstI restriction endonuclease HTH domain/BsuBI/PstI restriction endonuclease domain